VATTMRRLILTLSGWLLALGILVWHFASERTATAALNCDSRKGDFVETPAEPNPSREVRPALTRVYIKPHPPGWTSGRSIEFERFERVSQNGRSLIRFYTRNGTIEVPPDSVNWQGLNE
jgi:hypothetical protein